MRRRHGRHGRGVTPALALAAWSVVAVACSGSGSVGSGAPATTVAAVAASEPSTPSSNDATTSPRSPTTTAASATTDAAAPPDATTSEPESPTTVAGASTTVGLPLATTCGFDATPSAGAVTWTAAGKLWQWQPGADQIACLADVPAEATGPLRWSPSATQVLLGGSIVADTGGQRKSGYFPENLAVRWSAPTGTALVAPSVRDGSLVWRSSTDANERLDVSFLADTTYAVYHPAGKAIAAVGVDSGGAEGVFLASNRGTEGRALALVDDPANTEITELDWVMDGSALEFIHQHGSTYHVHHLSIAALSLRDVAEEVGTADQIVASLVDNDAVAWRRTLADGSVTVRALVGDPIAAADAVVAKTAPLTVDVKVGSAGSMLEPIGWLPEHRLAVIEHPTGAPEGAGTLWLWSPDGSTQQIATGVERAATRVVRGSFNELPSQIEQEAVG